MRRSILLTLLLLMAFVIFSCSNKEQPLSVQNEGTTVLSKKGGGEEGDPAVLAMMHDINDQLAAQGLNIAVEAIEFFTIGNGRPSNRIHQQPFRWVAGDPRRAPGSAANGIDITHLIDGTYQGGAAGVPAHIPVGTDVAIRTSMATWDADKALKKLALPENSDPTAFDPTIFDEFFPGTGDQAALAGFPFFADIVNAGWYPLAYFDAVVGGGPGSGCGVLAFSVTFIFGSGSPFVPSDINGDNYLDTALNEVYYNDDFGDPLSPCLAGIPNSTQPWGINIGLPGVDVETVALHENGHSLGIGHFGPPPDAVLNPIYAGIRQSPFPADHAGMAAVYGGWPQ